MKKIVIPMTGRKDVRALTVSTRSAASAIPAERSVVIAACGGVLGGALGNMIDRAAYGEVIDFLDVYAGSWHWPAFNVADAAITVGVIVLCLDAFRSAPAPERSII